MSRPESVTTQIVRETMAASLDQVNEKLGDADQPELTSEQLSTRRQWVRLRDNKAAQRDGSNGQANGHANGHEAGLVSKVLADDEPASAAPNGAGRRAKRRVPRAGSSMEFVCNLPFDLPTSDVADMANEAGFECSQKTVWYARKAYPNLRKRFSKRDAETFGARERAMAIKAGTERRLAVLKEKGRIPAPKVTAKTQTSAGTVVSPTLAIRAVHARQDTSGARAQLANVIMQIGMNVAEEVMTELREINQRFATGGKS
jgi:hypothetical protein